MKERLIDRERAVIAHDQPPIVTQPADSAFHDPAPFVAPQGTAVLGGRSGAVLMVGSDQFDAPSGQPRARRITVVTAVANHAPGLLPRTAGTVR